MSLEPPGRLPHLAHLLPQGAAEAATGGRMLEIFAKQAQFGGSGAKGRGAQADKACHTWPLHQPHSSKP